MTKGHTAVRLSSMKIAVLVVLGAFIPVSVAHAGFFSFVSNLFSKTNDIVTDRSLNSQNVALLEAALHPNPNISKGGGEITVVGDSALLAEMGPSGTLADIAEGGPEKTGISLYVVREGDSLSQIADMFGVTVNTIKWANELNQGSLISPGQTLVILPVSGVRHTVVKGDTLSSITKKYGGDIEEIREFNVLNEGDQLAIGDVVIIPDGEIAAPKYSAPSGGSVRGTNVPAYSGYYIRPISGGVRTQGLHGYNAVDLAAPTGTQIFASAAGTVIISKNYGWNGGYGSYVVIKHENGTQTLYAHTSRNIVSVGQWVVQGQVIGYIGSTGKSTGPHVHFEVRGAKNPF